MAVPPALLCFKISKFETQVKHHQDSSGWDDAQPSPILETRLVDAFPWRFFSWGHGAGLREPEHCASGNMRGVKTGHVVYGHPMIEILKIVIPIL